MPALVASYQKHQTVTRLKKAYSALSQAFALSEAQNGTSDGWELNPVNADTFFDFLNQYFFPYIKTIKTCRQNELDKCNFALNQASYLNGADLNISSAGVKAAALLLDGTSVHFTTTGASYVLIWVDVNGMAKPNVMGKDIFRLQDFYFATRSGAATFQGLDRDELVNGTTNNTYGCKNDGVQNGNFCTALIMHDGWEIKDDYPW